MNFHVVLQLQETLYFVRKHIGSLFSKASGLQEGQEKYMQEHCCALFFGTSRWQ